jgi:TPP-dependent pyruvate/acetoin dehydrogenase alpha subunit
MAEISPNWLDVAHTVLLSRKLDLLEVQQLTPQGKIKYQFSSAGHELAQVLVAKALNHPHDGARLECIRCPGCWDGPRNWSH